MNDADAMSGGIARGIEVNHVAIQRDGSLSARSTPASIRIR